MGCSWWVQSLELGARLAAALQGVARMAKAADERHWHISVPSLIAAAALGAMPLFISRVPWIAFACLTIAAFGIWSPHGPLMSWPAVILSGTNAASGDAPQQSSALFLNLFGAQAHISLRHMSFCLAL